MRNDPDRRSQGPDAEAGAGRGRKGSTRRAGWWLLGCTVAVLLAVQLGFEAMGRAEQLTGDAEWIWLETPADRVGPLAILAARDFELDAVPEGAILWAAGDEQMLLYLNGRMVGSGSFREGSEVLSAPVAELLRPGANRIVAELRSGRGAGGFLLALGDGDGGWILRTDRSWRLFSEWVPGLIAGWAPLGEGIEPRVWGRPPVGRWGELEEAASLPPATARPEVEVVVEAAVRRELEVASPIAGEPPVPARLWDWGEVVQGTLRARFSAKPPSGGLLYVSEVPIEPRKVTVSGPLIPVTDAPRWIDSEVRRFRYALVVAPGEEFELDLLATGASPRPSWFRSPPPLLGIEAYPQGTPIERRVWRGFRDR